MTEIASLDRRHLLKGAFGLAAAAALPRCVTPPPRATRPAERLVLVRFGAGVRGQDIFTDDPKSSLAPGLREKARSGALASGVHVEGSTGHRAATRVVLSGRTSTEADPERHLAVLRSRPTLFELWRASSGRPVEAAFAAGLPETSDAPGFGKGAGALAYLSEHAPFPGPSLSGDPTLGPAPLVAVANLFLGQVVASLDEGQIPAGGKDRRRLLRAAVERAVPAMLQAGHLGQLTVDALTDRLVAGRPYVASEEADDWLTELSLRAMRVLRPVVVGLGWSTTDLAHRGAWTTYAQQVRRADLLLDRLTRFLDEDPFYAGRTLVLVTTDCGRGDDRFDRHDPDLVGARQSFLVAYGAGAARGVHFGAPRPQVDVAATAARALGIEIPGGEGRALEELLA